MSNFLKNKQIQGKIAYHRGIRAENLAATYFKKEGWDILQRRFQCPAGEIDLIIFKEEWLIFVEVKVRRNIDDALHSLNHRQKKRLIEAAEFFIATYNVKKFDKIRFDVIAINLKNQIEHIKNITMV